MAATSMAAANFCMIDILSRLRKIRDWQCQARGVLRCELVRNAETVLLTWIGICRVSRSKSEVIGWHTVSKVYPAGPCRTDLQDYIRALRPIISLHMSCPSP